MRPRPALAVLVAIASILVTGCTTGARPTAGPATVVGHGEMRATKVAALGPPAVDAVAVATAKVPRIDVFASPDAATPSQAFDNPMPSAAAVVFVVQRPADGWYQVLLPIAPAGSVGWVRSSDVTISRHSYRIEVFLSEHRLEVRQQGELVLQAAIGVASASVPAPGRGYFTTELVKPEAVDGPLGAYAFGVSGASEDLAPFRGAPGQFGIHGTTDVSSIGGEAPRGSVSVRNADITVLASFLPAGVPVTVNP